MFPCIATAYLVTCLLCPFEHQLLLEKEKKKKNLQVFAFIIFLFLLKLILRLNFLGNQTWDLGYYVYLDDYYSG